MIYGGMIIEKWSKNFLKNYATETQRLKDYVFMILSSQKDKVDTFHWPRLYEYRILVQNKS